MSTNRLSSKAFVLSTVAIASITVLAAVTWLSPARSARAVSAAPILSSSYDMWQAGHFRADKESGLRPDATGPSASIQLGELQIFKMGVVGAAPLTTTLTSARILLERDYGGNDTAALELSVCEGTEVKRVISTVPVALNSVQEYVWIDIPLSQSPEELILKPSQYLCYTGTITSPEYIGVDMVIQAAVRYWAPPADQLYLPAVSN